MASVSLDSLWQRKGFKMASRSVFDILESSSKKLDFWALVLLAQVCSGRLGSELSMKALLSSIDVCIGRVWLTVDSFLSPVGFHLSHVRSCSGWWDVFSACRCLLFMKEFWQMMWHFWYSLSMMAEYLWPLVDQHSKQCPSRLSCRQSWFAKLDFPCFLSHYKSQSVSRVLSNLSKSTKIWNSSPSRSSRFWQIFWKLLFAFTFFWQASVFTICCLFAETSESGNLTFVRSKLPVGTNSFWSPTCSLKDVVCLWPMRNSHLNVAKAGTREVWIFEDWQQFEVFLLGKWREVNSYVFLCCLKRPSSRLQQELQDAVKQDKETFPMLTSKCSGRLPVEVIYRKEKYRAVLIIQWSFLFWNETHWWYSRIEQTQRLEELTAPELQRLLSRCASVGEYPSQEISEAKTRWSKMQVSMELLLFIFIHTSMHTCLLFLKSNKVSTTFWRILRDIRQSPR